MNWCWKLWVEKRIKRGETTAIEDRSAIRLVAATLILIYIYRHIDLGHKFEQQSTEKIAIQLEHLGSPKPQQRAVASPAALSFRPPPCMPGAGRSGIATPGSELLSLVVVDPKDVDAQSEL